LNFSQKGSPIVETARIRRLQIEDVEDISRIYAAIMRKPVRDDFKPLIESHATNARDACFVAEMGGKVVGFMISYVLTLGFGIEKSAWIATLGVDPDFWGQGIGADLARAVFALYKAEGITNVYTSVRWDSTDLLSFFKTLGFDRSNFINLRKVLAD
jgi:ribosomal protein S18 acetylase RimI-like enzyme